MPNYRRMRVPGGTVALTVTLADRSCGHLIDHIDLLRQSYASACRDRQFETLAICVLPDHFHALWQLPEDDYDYRVRVAAVKARFTRSLPNHLKTNARKGERGVWQSRFYEHHIRDAEDHATHVNYIHYNPVKHGLVANMDDWPHSTWHRFEEEYGREWKAPSADMRM